jgi:hypothetical protein
MSTVSHTASKGKKRRFRLAALGLLLLGLWGMLALLLGASVGKETHFHADLKTDLEPGFGETHATHRHPLDKDADAALHKDLLALCLNADCFGREDVVVPGYRDEPVDDGADDATSSIGRPRGPDGSPGTPSLNMAQGGAPFPNGLFLPGGLTNPNPGRPPNGGNPPDSKPDNPGANPNDSPPPDFTQPPFSNPPGLEDPGPHGPGSNEPGPNGPGPNGPTPDNPGPHGPDGPPNGGPDKPIQIPEPLTLSLFATGVMGAALLRRRKTHASK